MQGALILALPVNSATSGVSLDIGGTLYIIGKLFGSEARDGVASAIEHDRAYAANREGLAT